MALLWMQGLLFAVFVMLALWGMQKLTREPAVADVGWSLNVALLAVFYVVSTDGLMLRKAVAFCMAFIWGVRLAGYVFFARILGPQKDLRYRDAEQSWGKKRGLLLFVWFFLQGVLSAIFSLPCLAASLNGATSLAPGEWASFVLWGMAMTGEAVADWQLARFKADPKNRGEVCRSGLWKYSRHPNYFFEIMLWIACAFFASFSPHGYLAWACPAVVAFFLFRVSGIPMTELRALRTKGEKYREYQRTTSLLIPWFPKRSEDQR